MKIKRNVPSMTKSEAESLQTPATSGRNKGGKIYTAPCFDKDLYFLVFHKLWAGFSVFHRGKVFLTYCTISSKKKN